MSRRQHLREFLEEKAIEKRKQDLQEYFGYEQNVLKKTKNLDLKSPKSQSKQSSYILSIRQKMEQINQKFE